MYITFTQKMLLESLLDYEINLLWIMTIYTRKHIHNKSRISIDTLYRHVSHKYTTLLLVDFENFSARKGGIEFN